MAGQPSYVVDWEALTRALEMACQIRGLTLQDAAEAIGVPPSSLTRLRQGKHLSGDGLAALTAWLFPKDVPFWFKGGGPVTAADELIASFACGRTAAWLHIPGVFTRMGAMRCVRCCDVQGLPHGKGSPKNDDACRALLGLPVTGCSS